MAIGGTSIYLIKMALSFFGSDDVEMDDPSDALDSDVDFKFFSVQAILMLFLASGWMGIVCLEVLKFDLFQSVFVSVIFGFIAAFMEVYILAKVKGLQEVHERNVEEAIGKTGKVYLSIPEGGMGEIQIVFQGSMKNIKAMSKDRKAISAFTEIKVVEVLDGKILIVSPL